MKFCGIEVRESPKVPNRHWAGFDANDKMIAMGGPGWALMSDPLKIVRVTVNGADVPIDWNQRLNQRVV